MGLKLQFMARPLILELSKYCKSVRPVNAGSDAAVVSDEVRHKVLSTHVLSVLAHTPWHCPGGSGISIP